MASHVERLPPTLVGEAGMGKRRRKSSLNHHTDYMQIASRQKATVTISADIPGSIVLVCAIDSVARIAAQV